MLVNLLLALVVLAAAPASSLRAFAAENAHDHDGVTAPVDAGHADEVGDHGDPHGHDDHHDEPTGPHGGRLLESGDFAVEVSIFETGVAPQLRVYLYDDGEPIDPAAATLRLVLHRLAAPPEPFTFRPVGDFLLGDHVVAEPHSFEVELTATAGARTLSARYESFEARVTIPEEVAEASGVGEVVADRRDLGRTRRLNGRIGIPTDRIAQLVPRFAGIVRQASGRIGEQVRAGQDLAVLENSTTLSTYRLDAPIDGTILARSAVAGAAVTTGEVLYTIADLSEVWADFDVYRDDVSIVRPGETVVVRDDSGRAEATAKIAYVSPLRDVHTQTMLARAVLDNAHGRWAPGSFVTGTIRIDEEPAGIAVPLSALQTWNGRDAVFLHAEGIWEPRPVLLGRRGDEWVEILEGIDPGSTVATGNTFLLRAEIEKAGAAHDH